MEHFKLVSKYQPTGDQPQAIEALVKGFQEGNQFQTDLQCTDHYPAGKPERSRSGTDNLWCRFW